MGFSLKQALTRPKSLRKWQPKKLGNISWWKDFGGEVALPAAAALATGGLAGVGPLAGALSGTGSALWGAGKTAYTALGGTPGLIRTAAGKVLGGGEEGVAEGEGGGSSLPPWLLPAAAGGALAYGASRLGGGGGPGGTEKRNRAAFEGLVGDVEGRGTRMSDAYEQRAMSYDPYQSMQTAIEGAWNLMLPKMRGQQVSMGRLKTGFAAGDENERLQDLIASGAQVAEERGFQNMRDIGGYGERAMGTAMDARFGTYATERAAREQEASSKRGMWGNLLGHGINAAGRILAARKGA